MIDRAQLYEKAARYRAYVRLISDTEIARNILSLASELEERAMHFGEDDVRARAYSLWKQAGRPKGRDDEFWLLAEKELRSEFRSSQHG